MDLRKSLDALGHCKIVGRTKDSLYPHFGKVILTEELGYVVDTNEQFIDKVYRNKLVPK